MFTELRRQVLTKPLVFSISSPMDAARRRRFVAWFNKQYDKKPRPVAIQEFIKESGLRGDPPLTKGRVSQLFDEHQAFGERAAKALAVRLGLEEDYFLKEQPLSDDELAKEEAAIGHLRLLRTVDPETYERVRLGLKKIADGVSASSELLTGSSKAPGKGRYKLPEAIGTKESRAPSLKAIDEAGDVTSDKKGHLKPRPLPKGAKR